MEAILFSNLVNNNLSFYVFSFNFRIILILKSKPNNKLFSFPEIFFKKNKINHESMYEDCW